MPRRTRSLLQPPPPPSLATISEPEKTRVLRAELRCYLCAETCGVLETPPAATMPRVARFCAADGSPTRMLAWSALRCPRCSSGSLFLDEPDIVVRRLERVDWAFDRPRRGRPPRWLVALRDRQDGA
jgi:hypothetical protein